MTIEERERMLRLQIAEMHGVMPETNKELQSRVQALADLLKADRAVSDTYYAWLDVSSSPEDIDNPEYRAWVKALDDMGIAAANYIDTYIHRLCFDRHLQPKGFQEDEIVKAARAIMAGGA